MRRPQQRQRKTGAHCRPSGGAARLPLARGLCGNPKLHRLPESRRRAILRALRLAQELGAQTATLAAPSEERAVLRYAREHNLGKIIIGRRGEQRWKFRSSFADRLGQLGPDLDLVIVALEDERPPSVLKEPDNRSFSDKWRMQLRGCAVAFALCALITLLSQWLLPGFDQANLVMVYLLGVVIVALFSAAGRRCWRR